MAHEDWTRRAANEEQEVTGRSSVPSAILNPQSSVLNPDALPGVGLAALSGVLGSLAFPRWGLTALVWIAFVPLLVALRNRPLGARFALGFTTGLVGLTAGFYWVRPSIEAFLGVSPVLSALFFAIFVAWHSLQFGLFAALGGAVSFRWGALLAAPAWVSAEAFFPRLFPWQLGNALQPDLHAIQLAEITGVAGLGFAVMLVNALIAGAWAERRARRRALLLLGGAPGLVGALLVYGGWRVDQVEREDRFARSYRVAAVQGNMPALREADDRFLRDSLVAYSSLSRLPASRTQLIVWPEETLRTTLLDDAATQQALSALADETGSLLLVGAAAQIGPGESTGAYLVAPRNGLFSAYHKMRLLPFAEYLPGPFEFLRRWWPAHRLVPVDGSSVLLLPGTRIGPSICYESTFPGFFAPAVRNGAEFLVTITNDVWFGDSSGPDHHLQAAVMRAVESRRWLVRAANSGVSAIISPTGRIIARSRLFSPQVIEGDIRLRLDETLYLRWGDWFASTCAVLLAAFLLSTFGRRYRLARSNRMRRPFA